MRGFTAHRLRIIAQADTRIELNEHQGSAIRGALFHALRNRFCGYREAAECAVCPLATSCPVGSLVSTLRPGSSRGQDVPRPYTIQPPLPGMGGHAIERGDGRLFFHYWPGERFEFGLTLYAQALELFPYVVLALRLFETSGIGRRVEQENGAWERGKMAVSEIWAENPITGARHTVLRPGDRMVQVPDLAVTHEQVTGLSVPEPDAEVVLRFVTPARIIRQGRLVKPHDFVFQPVFQRLMDRLEALSQHFSATPLFFDDAKGLIEAAGRVRVVDNRLQWEELRSYSTRRHAESPISGLAGTVVLSAADWAPFWPWLVWGQLVHVGKDAVKGNGQYELARPASGGWDSEAKTKERAKCLWYSS